MPKKVSGLTCTAKEHVRVILGGCGGGGGLYPRKITLVYKPHKKDNEARLNFVNWYCHALHDGEIDPTLSLISGKAWFHLSELMNSQTKRFMLIHNS
jgi:hypothetical protein